MRKLIFIALFGLACSLVAQAVAPQQMRFHCEKDTTEINELLKKGIECGKKTPNAIMSFYAHELLGRPYVAHTLEAEKEWLTINIDELDCTTFVETLIALTKTTLSNRYSWRDYAHNLENVRYRNGEMQGYSSRLHYISEWIINNAHRGNLKDVTPDMDGVKYEMRTIDFMTKHRDNYKQLADSTVFEEIRNVESGLRNHRFPYVKKEWMKKKVIESQYKEGDIVAIVTKIEGLDIQHLGVITKEDGKVYLLDASMSGGKVQIEKDDLIEYLRRSRNAMGIRLFRVLD